MLKDKPNARENDLIDNKYTYSEIIHYISESVKFIKKMGGCNTYIKQPLL